MHLALRQFRPLLLGKHVLIRTDNTAAVLNINRLGGIRSHRMSQLARHLLLWSPTQFKSLHAVSSSPLLSLVQVPAKLAINLSIHTQHTYDNGVDRTGDRVFRKYSFLHEEREAEKNFFNPQTMLHLEYSLRTEKKKTPQHKSTYTINTWHCNRGKHIQLWQAAIRSSAMRRRSQTCSP